MGQDRHLQPLGPIDSAFWYLDTDTTPMNIGSVLIFEGQLDFDLIVKLVDSRIHKAPIYQQKIVSLANNMGESFWVYDNTFFIENHIHRMRLSHDGSYEELRQLAGKIISRRLDRSKPLWDLYVIEGLEDGNTALLLKVHHAMVDGISAVELFSLMMEPSADMPTIHPKPVYDPPPPPSQRDLWEHTLRRGIPHRLNMFKKIGESVLELGTHMLDREQRKRTLVGMLSYIHDHLTSIDALAINGKNTGRVEVAWKMFELQEIKRISKFHKASINDVMTTLLGCAITDYVNQQDEETTQSFVRLIVPVNLRRQAISDDEGIGNRISFIPIEAPLNGMNALERLEYVKRYSGVMKESELAQHMDLVLTLPAFAPAFTQPMIWGMAPKIFSALAHSWCTNVPGPPSPLYMLGHELIETYGFFPLNPSMGMATVILSYNNMITINIVADTGIINDVTSFRTYLDRAYDELIQTIPPNAPTTKPTTAIKDKPIVPSDTAQNTMQKTPQDAPKASVDSVHITTFEATTISTNGHVPEPIEITESVLAHANHAENTQPQITQNGKQNGTYKSQAIAPAMVKARIMSQTWATQLQDAINDSKSYYNASTGWVAGQLAFIMKADPQKGFSKDEAVLLDLHRGQCRQAKNVPIKEAQQTASFVLEASYDDWMELLENNAQPLPMILRGRLKLTKGSLRKLMPFTKSSQELVKCAVDIS